MHKKLLIIFFALFCFSFMAKINPVEAYSLKTEVNYRLETEEEKKCKSLLGDPEDEDSFAYMLQNIFVIMQYLGPLLCLIFSVMDFLKAAASQDKENLNKAFKTTAKRIVLAMALFFLPSLINFIFPLLGWYGTCGIE